MRAGRSKTNQKNKPRTPWKILHTSHQFIITQLLYQNLITTSVCYASFFASKSIIADCTLEAAVCLWYDSTIQNSKWQIEQKFMLCIIECVYLLY